MAKRNCSYLLRDLQFIQSPICPCAMTFIGVLLALPSANALNTSHTDGNPTSLCATMAVSGGRNTGEKFHYTYAVSDLFTTLDWTDESRSKYGDEFLHLMETTDPILSEYTSWGLSNYHVDPNKASFFCEQYDSYAEAESSRAKMMTVPSRTGVPVLREVHWIPSGARLATADVPKTTPPAVGPAGAKAHASGLSATAPDNDKDRPLSVAVSCKKIDSVSVKSEIQNTTITGSRQVRLTITNPALVKVECAFVAHKNGHWGVPGRQDIEAGDTVSFVSDTGVVSEPVVYRCVLAEDALKSTHCFPPHWWLNAVPTRK